MSSRLVRTADSYCLDYGWPNVHAEKPMTDLAADHLDVSASATNRLTAIDLVALVVDALGSGSGAGASASYFVRVCARRSDQQVLCEHLWNSPNSAQADVE